MRRAIIHEHGQPIFKFTVLVKLLFILLAKQSLGFASEQVLGYIYVHIFPSEYPLGFTAVLGLMQDIVEAHVWFYVV